MHNKQNIRLIESTSVFLYQFYSFLSFKFTVSNIYKD